MLEFLDEVITKTFGSILNGTIEYLEGTQVKKISHVETSLLNVY
jgi:hypothetical protein